MAPAVMRRRSQADSAALFGRSHTSSQVRMAPKRASRNQPPHCSAAPTQSFETVMFMCQAIYTPLPPVNPSPFPPQAVRTRLRPHVPMCPPPPACTHLTPSPFAYPPPPPGPAQYPPIRPVPTHLPSLDVPVPPHELGGPHLAGRLQSSALRFHQNGLCSNESSSTCIHHTAESQKAPTISCAHILHDTADNHVSG